MLHTPHYLRSSALIAIPIGLLAFSLIAMGVHANRQGARQSSTGAAILDLIRRQKYNEAITRLEQVLEREPGNSEALTYLATANLYNNLDFTKALKEFEEAFKAGGGATFFVTHSHEMFTTGDVVDYCRGWLNLRKDGVEFVPTEGTHGFKSKFNQVEEFKRNRLSKKAFHIKVDRKSQNFRGRSNTELEPLLIIALYKSFTPN
jgi:tetratricopeptide (TPR) repeat protein